MARQTEIQLKYRLRSQLLDSVTAVTLAIIKGFVALGAAYILYLTAAQFAGRYTFAQLALGLNSNIKFGDILSVVFGGGGIAYGKFQEKKKRDAIERIAPQLAKYQQEIDPKRSSSRLTGRGHTPPEIKQ